MINVGQAPKELRIKTVICKLGEEFQLLDSYTVGGRNIWLINFQSHFSASVCR